MFEFFKKFRFSAKEEEDDENDRSGVATGYSATQSAQQSAEAAAQKFAKPEKYTRTLIDSGAAKRNAKIDAFHSDGIVKDQFTGQDLVLTKAEAKLLYGENWAEHLAETDHIVPLEKRHAQTKDNPWLTNEDVRNSSNSAENRQIISRKTNNAKRSRSAKEFVEDEEYLKKTGVKLTEDAKSRMIESEQRAQKALNKQDRRTSVKNITQTGHDAGKAGAKQSGVTALTISGIQNIASVIKGEKNASEALKDTVVDGGKAAATGYIMSGGLTTAMHSMSASSSKFLQALSKSNVPGQVITAVIATGGTLKRYAQGEINTEECIIELGEKGLSLATTGYAMAVGQALIPIPIVGAAVGALVGSVLSDKLYHELINALKSKQLEHRERLRIIEESERAAQEVRRFRAELEAYLDAYFQDYRDCFDAALAQIESSFKAGDADGVVAGANQITRKLGGTVRYDTMDQFKEYMRDPTPDVF